MDWLLALRSQIGIPGDLTALGIDDTQAALIGKMAVADPSAGTNPIPFSASEYQALFLCAVSGNLEASG
jgi:hypothetical protein